MTFYKLSYNKYVYVDYLELGMKNGNPVWGLSRKGGKSAWWGFLVMCFVVMVAMLPFMYPEYEYLISYQYRAIVEFTIMISPALLGGMILLISGFFTQKDEWRMSLTGTITALMSWLVTTILSLAVFRIEAGELYTILLMFGIPVLIGVIIFLHSGFSAARHDKENPRQKL